MLDQVITAAGRFTEECSGLIETVGRIGGGEFLAGERSECSEKIDLAYERIRNARAHARRPTHEQGHARASFEAAVFTTAKLRGEYLADCNVAKPSAYAQDDALAERLWVESERIAAALV
jgi:GGDEF domain-containing protein